MKIIAIGDIHGRDFWKDIQYEEMDHLVFIGDYFDSYNQEISPADEIRNFQEIVELKRENTEMVSLLIGNHDYHYFEGINQRYERYQFGYETQIRQVLKEAMDVLQMCYVHNSAVFSHAGITKTWCYNNGIDQSNLEQSINDKFLTNKSAFDFLERLGDETGNHKAQSPIWVRPEALLSDKLPGFNQVVGHTRQKVHSIHDGVALIDVAGSLFVMEDVDSYWAV